MHKIKLLFLVILFVPVLQAHSQGLIFSGSSVPISERSSYLVFEKNTPSFKDSLRINFKLMIFPNDNYGNILRVSVHNTVFCLTCQNFNRMLVLDVNKEGYAPILRTNPGLFREYSYKWIDISLLFRLNDSSIRIDAGPVSMAVSNIDLKSGDNVRLVFGKEGYAINVPTFAIKDLNVSFDGTHNFFFPLNETSGNKPTDIEHRVKGSIDNPNWMTIDNWHWRQVVHLSEQEWSSPSYNPVDKSIYMIFKDSVYVVNYMEALGGRLSTTTARARCPVNLSYAMSFPDSTTNSILVYNFKKWDDYDSTTVASFDSDSKKWRQLSTDSFQSYLHKPAFSYYSGKEGFMLFGGLSADEYTDSIYFYSFEDKQLINDTTYTGDSVSPRYFSSMGLDEENNSCILFGGIGNETGRQISGKIFYYDCYKIDLSNKKITKLWETEWTEHEMVPIQNLLIKNNCFYTLCYQTYLSNSVLQLYEFDISDGTHRKLGDGIPIISEKRAAHAELYFDDTVNHLIAIVYDTKDYKTFNTSVYALNWPPTSVIQMAQRDKSRLILKILMPLIFLAIGFFLFMAWRINRRRKTLSEYESEQNSINTLSSLRKNAIYLFGDFTVIDCKGADISSRFSPKLKDILILIIARTIDSDGISSVKLSSRIWPELMWESSKNIRNVTINSLRNALSDVDGFKIVFEDEKYKVLLEDTCFCDLVEFAKIFKNPSRDNIDVMIGILNRGPFLKNASTELSDELKASTENDVITLLETQMPEYYQAGNYVRASYMAIDLLAIDPIHEKAIAILINSYRKLNKNAEAIMAYQEFVKEYQRTYDDKYPVAYRNI